MHGGATRNSGRGFTRTAPSIVASPPDEGIDRFDVFEILPPELISPLDSPPS